jgi:plasmid maintenance system antidote protein VapI
MDWSNFNNPTEVIMVALMKSGGLTKEDVAKKLCFSANEVFFFLGGKTRVTKQIKQAWAPFS